MDLNTHLMDPVVEASGADAAIAYVGGSIVGATIALPVLIAVFGL